MNEYESTTDRSRRREYDRERTVALATVGGSTVPNAAIDYDSPATDIPTDSKTIPDELRADREP